MRRLTNLGWTSEDAEKVIKVCLDRIAVKLRRAEQAEMRRQRQEEQRRLREERRKEKERLAKVKQSQRQADNAAKERLANDKLLANAAEKFAKRVDSSLADEFANLKNMMNRMISAGLGTAKVVATVIREVADDPSIETLDGYFDAVVRLLTPAESFAQ